PMDAVKEVGKRAVMIRQELLVAAVREVHDVPVAVHDEDAVAHDVPPPAVAPAPPPEHLRIILEIRLGQAATPVPPIGQEMASRRRSPEGRERQPRDSSISAEGIARPLIRLMSTRLRQTAAAAVLNRLWSLVPSGGSLPEGVWRAP